MKRFTALVLALLLVLTAAGCGQKEEPKPEYENHFADNWYEDGDLSWYRLEIKKDCSWKLYDVNGGEILCKGTGKLEDEQHLSLLMGEMEAAKAVIEKDGTLRVDPSKAPDWYFLNAISMKRKNESVWPTEETEPPTDETEPPFDAFVGLWKYDGMERWLEILEDGTWYTANAQSELLDQGVLTSHQGSVELDTPDGIIQLITTGPNTLADSLGNTLTASDEIATTPYFDSFGLYPNLMAGEGQTWLENGAEYIATDYSCYTRGPVYWEVEYLRDTETEGGLRDVTLMAICTLPDPPDEITYVDEYLSGVTSRLYDRYTGRFLAMHSTTIGDVDEESNRFSRTVEVNGEVYEIRYSTEIRWEYDDNGRANTMYKTFHVQFPPEYDGLLLCLMPSYDNLADYRAHNEQITDFITDIDLERVSHGLIFAFD